MTRTTRRCRADHERGVSLIELLVALAILAVGLTPLLSVFLHALKMSEKANKNAIITSLARDMAEEIRSSVFWDPNCAYDESCAKDFFPRDPDETPQSFGLEVSAGEAYNATRGRIGSFDDVDDYNGWCRGKNCVCDASLPTGVCVDESDLESYDGRKYDGNALPKLNNYTRRVEVFNIFPHITTEIPVPQHQVDVETAYNTSWNSKQFLYYNYNEENYEELRSKNDGTVATGITRLKIVKVTVEYDGPVVPPMAVEELNLITAPLSD